MRYRNLCSTSFSFLLIPANVRLRRCFCFMIIDGKSTAQNLRSSLRIKVEEYKKHGMRVPTLRVILVGDNPASLSYVNGKLKAAAEIGIDSRLLHLSSDCSESELLLLIEKLNQNTDIDGILVQLPLPSHINEQKLLRSINPQKDVDGFHPENVAKLWLGESCIKPCTPLGILALLDNCNIEIEGKEAVIVGRSNIVGKPLAKMLLDRNATVTIAHSHTHDLHSVTSRADILITAVGSPHLITADYVKDNAVVIDVGISRLPDGHLTGDVDFEEVKNKVSYITPVPGGVGPLTIAMLMQNTIDCYMLHNNKNTYNL